MTHYRVGSANKREVRNRKKLRQSPSLLMSRRNLSPVKEVQRDDFIDTADVVLNKEIALINQLVNRKIELEQDITNLKCQKEEAEINISKTAEVQPKFRKQIFAQKQKTQYVYISHI